MTLRGPGPDDVRRLHAEINQILNQQHLITAAAITTFGVVLAWLMPRGGAEFGTGSPLYVLLGSFLLLFLLLLLFLWTDGLTGIVRTYSAYLALHQSGWEEDWQRYRKRFFHMGYSRIQGSVFVALGILAAIFPIYLFGIRALWEQYPRLTAELYLALLLYQVIVIGRAVLDWPDRAKRERKRWAQLQAEGAPTE